MQWSLDRKVGILAENSNYEEEFLKTGHAYGYFASKPTPNKDTKSELTCVIPLLQAEYEAELREVKSIMNVSAFADIITDFNEAFATVVSSMRAIDNPDLRSVKKIQRALESYIESIVRTVTHFKNKIETVMGKTDADNFSRDVSLVYDQGDSYALFYKLRNVYQHKEALPLKLNRSLNQDGSHESKLILDSNKLLNEHTSNYLNEKVKGFLLKNPEIDIYLHAAIVFEQLSSLFDSFIKNTLLDEERALECSHQIKHFASLDDPTYVLHLTDMSKKTSKDPDSITMNQTHVPLEYLCKLLSLYLKGRPELLFSYWGQPLEGKLQNYLPGAYNLISPEHFNNDQIVSIQGEKYSWQKKTLSLDGDSAEMMSLFYVINSEKPSKEQINTYWDLYNSLVKGLKILNRTPASPNQETPAE